MNTLACICHRDPIHYGVCRKRMLEIPSGFPGLNTIAFSWRLPEAARLKWDKSARRWYKPNEEEITDAYNLAGESRFTAFLPQSEEEVILLLRSTSVDEEFHLERQIEVALGLCRKLGLDRSSLIPLPGKFQVIDPGSFGFQTPYDERTLSVCDRIHQQLQKYRSHLSIGRVTKENFFLDCVIGLQDNLPAFRWANISLEALCKMDDDKPSSPEKTGLTQTCVAIAAAHSRASHIYLVMHRLYDEIQPLLISKLIEAGYPDSTGEPTVWEYKN